MSKIIVTGKGRKLTKEEYNKQLFLGFIFWVLGFGTLCLIVLFFFVSYYLF